MKVICHFTTAHVRIFSVGSFWKFGSNVSWRRSFLFNFQVSVLLLLRCPYIRIKEISCHYFNECVLPNLFPHNCVWAFDDSPYISNIIFGFPIIFLLCIRDILKHLFSSLDIFSSASQALPILPLIVPAYWIHHF